MNERSKPEKCHPNCAWPPSLPCSRPPPCVVPTVAKTGALRTHLDTALADATLPPQLRDALEQALAGWRAVECHPASISVPLCPLTTPGQSLH